MSQTRRIVLKTPDPHNTGLPNPVMEVTSMELSVESLVLEYSPWVSVVAESPHNRVLRFVWPASSTDLYRDHNRHMHDHSSEIPLIDCIKGSMWLCAPRGWMILMYQWELLSQERKKQEDLDNSRSNIILFAMFSRKQQPFRPGQRTILIPTKSKRK